MTSEPFRTLLNHFGQGKMVFEGPPKRLFDKTQMDGIGALCFSQSMQRLLGNRPKIGQKWLLNRFGQGKMLLEGPPKNLSEDSLQTMCFSQST